MQPRHSLRLAIGTAAIALAFAAPARAAIDFESPGPSLFVDGDSFLQGGFRLAVVGDFGIVDTAAAFDVGQAPVGNATRFYAGLNDSSLWLTRADGGLFSLDAFDAAFIAPTPQAAGVVAGRLRVSAIDGFGATVSGSWELAASDADGSFRFATFAATGSSTTPAGAFASLRSATFDACVYDGDRCVHPFDNLGQFALDNVVAVIPEPSTHALLAFGLAGIAAFARRAKR